jgi:hypothetical protein
MCHACIATHSLLQVLTLHLLHTTPLCCAQVTELLIYLALLAKWSLLLEGPHVWGPWALLAATVVLPVMYSRRIVDWDTRKSC